MKTSPRFRNPAWQIFLLLFGYLALQVLLRAVIAGSVELDESEQLVMTQEWRWGYGVQPPLYTWLQIIFFNVFGINVFALALLKNLCLGGTFVFTYRTVKELAGDVRAALVAMTSLVLLPQIIWESQRDQTQSVLATMCAAAALYLFLRQARNRSWLTAALFGLVALLGCLSKYNYAVFLVALLLTAASLKEYRPALVNWRMLLALAVFVGLGAPHIRWMLTNSEAVLARANEVHEHAANLGLEYVDSLGSMVTAFIAFSGIAAAVFAAIFFRAAPVNEISPAARGLRQFIDRLMITGLLVCLALVLISQAHFKDRWMQPLLFVTPLWLTLRYYRRLEARRVKALLWFNAVVAGVAFIVLNATPPWAVATGQYRYLYSDYANLAAQLKAHGFERGVIVAINRRVGGNLRFTFQDSTILAPECPRFAAAKAVPWVVVWSAVNDSEIAPPPILTNMVWALRGTDLSTAQPVLAAVPYEHAPAQTKRFAFLYLPAPPVN